MSELDTVRELRDIARSPENVCFGCGPGNPAGLKLRFEQDGDTVRASFQPGDLHGGWAGVVHGGILATALDEAMAYVLYFAGIKGLTARMDVRYRLPVMQGDQLTVEARATRDTRRIVDVEAHLRRDGQTVAEGSGRFMKVGPLDPDALVRGRAATKAQ